MGAKPLVLYHANCADGFCAAWAAHREFGHEADYLPVQYGQSPPDLALSGGRKVYVLDFSYKRDVLIRLAETNNTVVMLDHHKTARAEFDGLTVGNQLTLANTLPGRVVLQFDMEKSGGRLAWEHFHPGKPAPWLVDYTEDRDLWRWRLDWSKEISAFVASHPFRFRLWDQWSSYGPGCPAWDAHVDAGAAILRYQSQLVDSICAAAREVDIDGHRVMAANTSCLFSEVAGKLAEGRPFGAAFFTRSDGKVQWSLRSRDEGVDVSEIAKRHGGGGHRNAAGFEAVSA